MQKNQKQIKGQKRITRRSCRTRKTLARSCVEVDGKGRANAGSHKSFHLIRKRKERNLTEKGRSGQKSLWAYKSSAHLAERADPKKTERRKGLKKRCGGGGGKLIPTPDQRTNPFFRKTGEQKKNCKKSRNLLRIASRQSRTDPSEEKKQRSVWKKHKRV